jgi:hypothetical protein
MTDRTAPEGSTIDIAGERPKPVIDRLDEVPTPVHSEIETALTVVNPTVPARTGELPLGPVSTRTGELKLDPDVMARLKVAAPRPSLRAFHPWRAVVTIVRSILVSITPYSPIVEPNLKQADFPIALPPDLHAVIAAAMSSEDQRTVRFDAKASAFLSTSGILIPLIATVITAVSGTEVRAILLTSVTFAALAGVAAFRALQLKVGTKLSVRVGIQDDGTIRSDAGHRHTLTLLHVLKTEEAGNDQRAVLLRASSVLLGLASLALVAATAAIVV